MAKVIHFEIPADDPDRAVAFYTQAFGWKIESWGGPFDSRRAQRVRLQRRENEQNNGS